MDPEEKGDNPKDFGNVVDALHNKQKLHSLRTYQGDMAEFIKSKDESVASIVLKEKKRKEEREKEEELKMPAEHASGGRGFQINLTIILLSLLLIGGGIFASVFVFDLLKNEPTNTVITEKEIIPYSNLVTLANITKESLGQGLAGLSFGSGVNIVKISDLNGVSLKKSSELFNFLKISLPAVLERTLRDEYAIGVFSQNGTNSYFVIITVNDFGQAFSAMLDWEENMAKDLSFLNPEANVKTVAENIATSTASTTVVNIKTPIKQEIFSWKDIIVKNKDTRAFANEKNRAKVAYTFLDKNTILVVNNLSVIGDISQAYASRAVVR